MTVERVAMLVKKVTYFGEFGYLSSSFIGKRYYFNVFETLERYINIHKLYFSSNLRVANIKANFSEQKITKYTTY